MRTFKVGDRVNFITWQDNKIVDTGTVTLITPEGKVHVQYDSGTFRIYHSKISLKSLHRI